MIKNELNSRSYKNVQTTQMQGKRARWPMFPSKQCAQAIFRFMTINTSFGDHLYLLKS